MGMFKVKKKLKQSLKDTNEKKKQQQKNKVYQQLLMLPIKIRLLGIAVFTNVIEFRDLPNAKRDLKSAFFLRVLLRKFFPF